MKNNGFTLIEILVVIGVIGVLFGATYLSIEGQKNKAKDLQVKQKVSELHVQIQQHDVAAGTVNYELAFSELGVPSAMDVLGAQLHVAQTQYEYGATLTEYAIVFPLSNGKFYCVDSTQSVGEVAGLLNISGPRSCANATRVPPDGGDDLGDASGTSDPSARTLTALDPISVPSMGPYAKYSYYESLPRGYNDDTSRLWPLLIFIHGQGEQSAPLSNVLRHGVAKEISSGAQLEYMIDGSLESFVVLMPQSDWWHPYLIDFFIEKGKQSYRIDPNRIYLSGLSVGTSSSITYAAYSTAYAQKVAAIGVSDGVYGGIATQVNNPGAPSSSLDYCRINQAGIPMWMFYANGHAPSWTLGVRDILNNCSPSLVPPLKLTYCTTSTCVSRQRAWDQAFLPNNTYQNPNIYEWLLMQSR